jgi:hypothetical protein
MRISFCTFLLASAALLAACGHGDDKTTISSSTQNLSYDYVENQCDTGSHSADSHDQLCNNLKDDALNKGCAYDLRKQAFSDDGCSGSFGG